MPPKIFVGNVYGRSIEVDHHSSLLRLFRFPNVMFRPGYNDALLCRARSKTATRFLESDADVHVSIDGDIVFAAEDVQQIADQACNPETPIVGGVYVTRARLGGLCRPTTIFNDDEPIEFSDDPTPRPVKWLATGFMATHRRVFETLAKDLPLCHPIEDWSFYPFYQPFVTDGPNGPIYLSEDYALCERARLAGFGSFVNPSVRLMHFGQHGFRLEDMTIAEPPTQPIQLTRTSEGRYRVETYDLGEDHAEPQPSAERPAVLLAR